MKKILMIVAVAVAFSANVAFAQTQVKNVATNAKTECCEKVSEATVAVSDTKSKAATTVETATAVKSDCCDEAKTATTATQTKAKKACANCKKKGACCKNKAKATTTTATQTAATKAENK